MNDLLATSRVKASGILYVASAVMLLFGCLLPMMDTATRMAQRQPRVDTVIEMVEWNPYSQAGVVLGTLSVFLFSLGIMTDRRGA